MRLKILFWITLLVSSSIYSQTIVKGRLLYKENDDPIYAVISLIKDDKKQHTITDENGYFSITLEEQGTYKLETQALGIMNYNKTLVVTDKDIDLGTIYLEEDVRVLDAVVLFGHIPITRDYTNIYAISASKINLKTREITQSVSSITSKLIYDKQAFRTGDVLNSVTGVTPVNAYHHYAIRGVTPDDGTFSNRLINGMKTTTFYFNQQLSANLEKIEVIKGPSSMTFSNTAPGGAINMITKKPLKEAKKSVTLSAGSFGTLRSSLDFTGPLNKNKTLLYRLNVGYESSDGFRDYSSKKAYLISPSFTYAPTDKTKFNFEIIYTDDHSRLDRGQPLLKGAKELVTDFSNFPTTQSVAAADDYYKNKYVTIIGSFTHKLKKNLTLNLSYLKDNFSEDLREHRVRTLNADNPNLINLQAVVRKLAISTDNFQAYFNTDFNLGAIKNKAVFGYDLNIFKTGTIDWIRADNYTDGSKITFDLNNPKRIWFNKLRDKKNTWQNKDYDFYIQPWLPQKYTVHGAYLQNQMEWNNFIFNFGLRQDWYVEYDKYKTADEKTVTQNHLTKRFGLMYKANKNINLYSAYVDGFLPQPTSKQAPGSGGPFDPLVSDMIEFGAKTQWLNGNLNVNLAVYQINQKNILVKKYPNDKDPAKADLLTQRGEERNRGFEIDVVGSILPNWSVSMGYAYLDAKIIESENGDLDGAVKSSSPKNSFNSWTRYDFQSETLKNIGVGLGVNYVDSRSAWYDRNLIFPSYTVVNGAIYYKIKDAQFSINTNNIFDKKYWIGGVNKLMTSVGSPRSILFTATYNF